MNTKIFDAVIIGGGIVGTATAFNLQKKGLKSVLVIEAEKDLAAHQTGHNSGVIHSGVYYKPGSLKAKLCSEGRELLYNFCKKHNILFERCGKIIVATEPEEISVLKEIEKRGIENGLENIKRLNSNEINELEPYSSGIEGLLVPQTGIVDFIGITNKLGDLVKENGGEVVTSCRFLSISKANGNIVVETTNGEFNTKLLINCGGLQSDRIAIKCGLVPDVKIIPFRGEYYKIRKEKEYLVNNLIYPVPDPKFPFLGVHFTRMVKGGVEAGPNAVLAFKRNGYTYKDVSLGDLSEMFLYPGFWKMARQHYAMGINEFKRSFSKSLFVKALKKLIPSIEDNDVIPGGAGVRAQALDRYGKLVDDLRIIENEKQVHVLNAPSPAATASLAIGNYIAERAIRR